MSNILPLPPHQTSDVENNAEKPLSDNIGQDTDISLPVIENKPTKPVRTRTADPKPKKVTTPQTKKTIEIPKSAGAPADAEQTVAVAVSQDHPVISVEADISHEEASAAEQIPDDLLLAFKENYRTELNSRKQLITTTFVLLFLVAAGSWYFVKQKSFVTGDKPLQTMTTEQEKARTTIAKTSESRDLPTFIPREGYDGSYAVKNPGWESYTRNQINFRVFSVNGKLKAVQIRATSNNYIPDSLVKSVLTELAGSSDYQISSRENRSGFLMLRGTVAHKANVLFYKNDSKVTAFVVSIL